MTVKATSRNSGNRQPMTDTKLLMLIAIGIFVVMYGAAMLFIGKRFLNTQEIFNLLNNNAYLIILGCSLTIVMIGGGIDISVGGVVCLSAMSCAKFLQTSGMEGVPGVIVSLLLALGIGLLFGLEQGFLVSYLGIQPFIVTLAGMFLSRGVTTMISSENVPIKHEAFLEMKKTALQIPSVGKLELGAIIALLILLLMYLLLRHHRLGRSIYALGGNQQSALMLGINVKRSRFLSYVISGVLSGLAGYIFIMHASSGKTSIGLRSEMDAIASAIIGGTLLTGGVGNVFGAFFGVMILSTIQEIMAASKVQESYWQEIASGSMLALFILMQSVVLSRRGKKMSLPAWIKFKKE
ncbi:MAG: sugar ABC transporter permease YjfF [Clostridia bacterium]|nr:sugar ABC transporter permease YjfF [Clostridia bacterium]MBR4576427.1 sugar ABC transporter permease YjfF [Clostridia bacterium]